MLMVYIFVFSAECTRVFRLNLRTGMMKFLLPTSRRCQSNIAISPCSPKSKIQNPNPTLCEIHESSSVPSCLSSPSPSSLIVHSDFILNRYALKDAYIHFYNLICITSHADLAPPTIYKAGIDDTWVFIAQYHISANKFRFSRRSQTRQLSKNIRTFSCNILASNHVPQISYHHFRLRTVREVKLILLPAAFPPLIPAVS